MIQFSQYEFSKTNSRFTKELKDDSAGLLAAAFIGIVPGYISRSVAGSYDNEAIAIFLLMFTFFSWIKALKQGSAFFGTIAALFYFYMVAAWGLWHITFLKSLILNGLPRWLCVYNEHDPSPCISTPAYGTLHQPPLRCVFIMVCHWHACEYAGPLRGLPARKDKRTHGCSR